jgi:hypothetical protein
MVFWGVEPDSPGYGILQGLPEFDVRVEIDGGLKVFEIWCNGLDGGTDFGPLHPENERYLEHGQWVVEYGVHAEDCMKEGITIGILAKALQKRGRNCWIKGWGKVLFVPIPHDRDVLDCVVDKIPGIYQR